MTDRILMFRICQNRYLDAFLKLLLFSSIVHTILMIVYVIAYNDIEHLNYFNILDISLFIPYLEGGLIPDIVATTILFLTYVLILWFFTRNKDE